ncbi:F-box domain, cyclin-like protein [Artemisia annua]|uniref:F-box domain, cyclin-like protein n=1 Tax=Artemisia annua TaxID=35608 RepID=A0A2U1LNZ7_ARTAN|nr:F-box domain, cyclin-like protein [Artemisia annua]
MVVTNIDNGLYKLSTAKCIANLSSISLWGMTGITDKGVIHLISRANSSQHLNFGGTFITDDSLLAIATSCPNLKVAENGLIALVNNCRKLETINVWGMSVPVDSFYTLLAIRPALQILPQSLLNIGTIPLLPFFEVITIIYHLIVLSSSGNVDRESIAGVEASITVDQSVPSESQQPLNANVSEPQESQVTSAAISMKLLSQ